ncbi:hypothetical protein ETAA8_40470 [Anatilimnocola aggregata]|uniref:Uncharacterized protein n=1 Tax=Anatilimnocola aggregata TaxID=2528021 RepID=A0A517YFF6_9BACT|nr:hypothetical protein [Anatilimnocola aggregata]QDU28941.1 hypothetical protein ETAA8_40470 [Anatilimnocola aggregata]
MTRSIKKAKRVRIQGTDTRLEIQYVIDSAGVRPDHDGPNNLPAARGWVDADGSTVEDLGNGKFKRTSDGTVFIAEE